MFFEPFQPVELFHATVKEVFRDGSYCIVLDKLNKPLEVPLPHHCHGVLKNGLLQTFYKGDELQKNLLPPVLVNVNDRILIHLARGEHEVVRWQKFPVPVQQSA